jgi:hypothetical protein
MSAVNRESEPNALSMCRKKQRPEDDNFEWARLWDDKRIEYRYKEKFSTGSFSNIKQTFECLGLNPFDCIMKIGTGTDAS